MPNNDGIRNFKRIPVKLEAEIISDGIKYSGFIEDVSEYGLNITTFSMKGITTFIPGAVFELEFQPSGEKINLNCEIKRVEINKKPPHDLIYTIAVGITEQPPEYKKFLKTLK